MPEPAGTGLSRRTFLSRSAGLALAVYGASKLPLAAFEEGIAQAAAAGQDPRLDLLRRRHRLAQRAGAGRRLRATRTLRPTLALAPERRHRRSARTPRLRWHPAAAALATLHGEGKVSAFPAIGYDQPEPVALHLAPLLRDRRARGRRPHRLARPLHRPGRRRRQPAAGPLDGRRALADARHRRRSRWRRSTASTATTSGRAVGDPVEQRDVRQLRAASARCPPTRPALAPGAPRDRADRQAAPGPRRLRRLHQPGRPTRTTSFAHKLAGLAALHRRRAADAGA